MEKENTSDGKVVWTNSEEASNYAEARPDYPPDVVEISMEYLRYKYKGPLTAALDIGCGTGKSTEHLIPKFGKVYGCDPSEAMLQEARGIFKAYDNVSFEQANAEDLSRFPDKSFELIIASRCIHYFDSKKFFAEAERLLVPNGVLVFYTLQFEVLDSPSDSSLKNQLTNAYDEYLENWVGDYWLQPKYLPKGFKFKARNRKEYYTEILEPPFPEKKISIFNRNREISLKVLRNLLVSYSASVRYREDQGDENAEAILDKCLDNIKSILGEDKSKKIEDIRIEVQNEFFMVLSRKPDH